MMDISPIAARGLITAAFNSLPGFKYNDNGEDSTFTIEKSEESYKNFLMIAKRLWGPRGVAAVMYLHGNCSLRCESDPEGKLEIYVNQLFSEI